MEKDKDSGQDPFLPFLYQLRQRRERCPIFAGLVFMAEAFFVGMLPLEHSSTVADPLMERAVEIYQGNVINNETCMLVITTLSFLLPVTLVLALTTLALEQRIENTQKHRHRFEKIKYALVTALIVLEIVILPGFLMAAQNIINSIAKGVLFMSIVNFSFGIVLMLLDSDRRLYQGHSVVLVLVRMMMPFSWTPLVVVFLSIRLAAVEERWHKRVAYYQFGIWQSMITISSLLNTQTNSFQLILALALTAAAALLAPRDHPHCKERHQENESLMQLAESMQQGRQLYLQERIMVNRAMFTLREELLAAQQRSLAQKEQQWLSRQCGTGREDIVQFLYNKMSFELRKEYSHSLKMQQLQCEVRLGRVSMKTLYELQSLILQLKGENSFQDREQLHRLVAMTDRRFLSKELNANANATILRQRQLQILHEIFINIAIIMQEFWTLHRDGRLGSRLIDRVLGRVSEMQAEAQGIIRGVGRSGSTRHQLATFQFLRKLISNSHRSGEWRQPDPEKQDALPTDNRSYIVIEQGNILAMSSRLLNEFELSRKEAQGFKLGDIVGQQTALFLAERLDRLIQEQPSEESAFLLPLKVSREKAYIQLHRAEVQILPELMNGIKYMLHLQKAPELQRTPCLLYCGNTDSVLAITRNFVSYFNLVHDHYLFRDFTHELFSADLLAVAQCSAKEGTQVICEFRAKRMAPIIEGHSKRIEGHSKRIEGHSKRIEGNSVVANVPVVMKKLKQYQVAGQTVVLLSIIKREELKKTQSTNLISEKIVFLEERESKDGKEGKEKKSLQGKTFCRISNPYQNLIDEKVQKMQQFYRMSYLKGLLLVIAALLLALLCTLITIPLELSTAALALASSYQARILQNQRAVEALNLFTRSATLYLVTHHPQQLLSANPKLDMPALVEEYTRRVDQNIEKVLEYTIKIEMSGLKETKASYSIYDVLGNAKLAIATQNVTDVVSKWPAVRAEAQEKSASLGVTTVTAFFSHFTWGAILVVFLLVVAGECLSLRAQQMQDQILRLYEHIDGERCQRFAQKYRIFAHGLYSSSCFRGVKAQDYLRKYKDGDGLEAIEQVSTLLYLEKVVGIDMQLQEIDSRGRDSAKESGEKKIKRKFFLGFLWKESFIMLLVIFFAGVLHVFMFYLTAFQGHFNMVLDHQQRIHHARGNLSLNTASFMMSSLQEVLPPSQRIDPVPPTHVYLTSELSSKLPKEYAAYSANLTRMTRADLCSMGLIKETLYRWMDCEAVIGGIIRNGFPQTMVFFNDLTLEFSFTPMSTLGTVYRPKAIYPVFLQIMYLRRTVDNLIASLQKSFNKMTKTYIERQTEILNTVIRAGWILVPLFLIILAFFYGKMSRKCAIALKSFFILPKEYLLEMRVTKVLRQRDILNKIQRLAF